MEENRSQKLQLVAEIHGLLEAGDRPLVPVTRKALRLAKLCGDIENGLLLQLHLDGTSEDGKAGLRVDKWPDPNIEPKWDVVDAFHQDRILDEGKFLAFPLEQIESMLVKLEQEAAKLSDKELYSAASKTRKMAMDASVVISRIRNRIANFVGQVETDLYSAPDQTEQPDPKDMESGAMGSNVTKIIVALIGLFGVILVGYWQFGSKDVLLAPVNEQYVGRVTNVATNEPIYSAKVSIEADQNVPQVQKTDSDGVFRVMLRPKTQSVVIRVEAPGFETLEEMCQSSEQGLSQLH